MPAYYRTTIQEFLQDDTDRIHGVIHQRSSESGFTDLKESQSRAWRVQLQVLQRSAAELLARYHDAPQWGILFEYPIPRRQKRIDVVLLPRDIILCLEFKTGESKHQKSTARQVEDYALDLRDFHEESRERAIVPIAVTIRAQSGVPEFGWDHDDLAKPVVRACEQDLTEVISACVDQYSKSLDQIDAETWDNGEYRPVPTIIEAAEALYAGHDVREIARSHADAQNLGATSDRLVELIREAHASRSKLICIVTGVPGAGKTLAGLNVAHDRTVSTLTDGMGVFLSGNGPLVKIVSAAIAKDFKRRKRSSDADRTVSTFIQNVHAFIRDSLPRSNPPNEHLIIFDEAQRAWDADQCFKKVGRQESEPELILSIMDRHPDWAVIVALVGGGQEINTGEAGLSEWGRSLQHRFPKWRVAVSPKALVSGQLDRMQQLFADGPPSEMEVLAEPALHLNVSLRSYKAEAVSKWVDAVVAGDSGLARQILPDCEGFHLALTRDLASARKWLREHTRGERRSGLLASSGAMRLRAEGIELSSGFRQGNKQLYVDWFLNDLDDIRASNQLEVAATEYECQGLELDLTSVCWGGDLQMSTEGGWQMRKLIGSKWNSIKKARDQRYLLNSYRVLMTRAREGMIIWVPRGSETDPTQAPADFDRTAEFLLESGLQEV